MRFAARVRAMSRSPAPPSLFAALLAATVVGRRVLEEGRRRRAVGACRRCRRAAPAPRGRRRHRPPPPPPPPAPEAAAPAAAGPGGSITGKIEIPAALAKSKPEGTLFLVARRISDNPSVRGTLIAVKKLPATKFPLAFDLSGADMPFQNGALRRRADADARASIRTAIRSATRRATCSGRCPRCGSVRRTSG